ncbi:uncharacterized protein LOC121709935 isoform X2 [Alosa sapidissima]|uniref:uncharacterized protein LOC121709935 isoform X2 n=1 Tax=Alosa sapidissima TaxID=34773 RepID=UPI001C08473D|nr:uncharacterized protein LOC121709935 isoform X2 [Alosa sapidissima]
MQRSSPPKQKNDLGFKRNMFNSHGFLFHVLFCLCTCSDIEIPGDTVNAKLNGSIEFNIQQEPTVCNFTVEWYKHTTSTLCLRFEAPNITCLGDCCKKAQFHCQNNSLVLNSVTLQDEGKYIEKIMLQNGTIKKNIFTLKIIYPPCISNVSIISTQSTLMVMCEASGGSVSYSWLKDGQALQNMNQTLMVHEATQKVCGKYTCVAANEWGSTEAHVNVNGEYAICRGLDGRHEIKIVSAVICALCFCVIAVCIKKYHAGIFSNESWTPEDRGNRGPNTGMEEDRIYDEPSNVQPNPPEVVQLPYVYTDFIPGRFPTGHAKKVKTEAGYSTIGEVQEQVQTLRALEQAETPVALEQAETPVVLEQAPKNT